MANSIALIGAQLGWGAQIPDTELGPVALKQSQLESAAANAYWRTSVAPSVTYQDKGMVPFEQRTEWIIETLQSLANEVEACMQSDDLPVVLGGDHSIAVGTFSGVTAALKAQQAFGLLWVDAHMDANTHETTPSNAIHGMPLAALLGRGMSALTHMQGPSPKLNPKHVALVGIRSFETGEKALLEELGVRVFYMDECEQRGLDSVMDEAVSIVSNASKGFGMTIDLDGFDPIHAPGVGSPEKDGLCAQSFLPLMRQVCAQSMFKALEITEYNPMLDEDKKTLKLVHQMIAQLNVND